MEPHEVFVPFPAETIRQALADLERVARCVPGLQRDAGAAEGLAGRLRLRIGGSTITYRGTLRLAPRGGGLSVEGEAVEARGAGTVKLALEVGVDAVSGGTLLTFTGGAQADGRLAEYDDAVAAAAGVRLLDRFAAALTSDLEPAGEGIEEIAGLVDLAEEDLPAQVDEFTVHDVHDVHETRDARGPETGEPGELADHLSGDLDAVDDDLADDDLADDLDEDEDIDGIGPIGRVPDVPEDPAGIDLPAEAAYARRTLIGRSAEEVDHAPPRGRYAPVPAPQNGSATASLRRYAPAAAALLLSAVVAGRVLRRRRRSFP
ncbi:SRPBCC domain-containing protein [Streptomyces sp. NPDC088354]|uniref:SRPBCC domain-containing protein n=1 Tax=unclassified Streptomyces TaxID=2593676 RepID=UPI0029B224CD|nr:SRPBCC domain-containing protein [Streptomyces sp. MI02-7b]MDX3073506.1 SRPBCC domain-containing protein [Streptomyces sp. MI02-7b]